MRYLALILLLSACTEPLGKVCNPSGQCAMVIADTKLPKMNDYLDYVPSNVQTVTIEGGRDITLLVN